MYVNKSICFFHFCTKCAILSQIDVQNLTLYFPWRPMMRLMN